MSEFDEYIVHDKLGQKDKADARQSAIGLHDVDEFKIPLCLLGVPLENNQYL